MLEVRDLSVARGGVPILQGVSFSLGPGEALVLRGPNGIGKTTLLRALAGLQPPISGETLMEEGAGAYASHADGIKAQLTVEENLAFWARVHGQEVPEDLYEAFDLTALRTRHAGTLSAGQKRRTGLARLGVTGKPVLFLDEPTVSLDRFSVTLFADFLRDRHLAKGGAAVIATHIDLGLEAPEMDLTPFAASPEASGGADEAFL
ncbi:heme ABC exporter ATP-binding protein CcmA [Histidinibacterium aquaticum]|uniref:Heme ABC exporter ATP-binding protein CcmA n=1 Tax=Histidinibacterium aquaticum TaxID=2613962 RepID=A0A5J5GPZ3_9RHOB|nr:heme ABC exporter ATP-binding protein CcmA [Histidinibacterium aquaticum]KAA9009512.1 heme ABC exporter ATP-binding protein CcmA [Histidinibacterium aquaticum]